MALHQNGPERSQRKHFSRVQTDRKHPAVPGFVEETFRIDHHA